MKRPVIVGVVVLAAAAVVAGLTLGSDSDSGDDRSATATTRSTTTTTPGPLTGAAAELVALLDKGVQATSHIKYTARSSQAGSAAIDIELWRKGGKVRQDTFTASSNQRTLDLFAPTGGQHCTKAGDGPWSCAPTKGGDAGPDAFLSALRAQLSSATVAATDDTVAGRAVRCFAIEASSQKARLCLQGDGLTVAVQSDQASLELVSADSNVSDDVFTAPA